MTDTIAVPAPITAISGDGITLQTTLTLEDTALVLYRLTIVKMSRRVGVPSDSNAPRPSVPIPTHHTAGRRQTPSAGSQDEVIVVPGYQQPTLPSDQNVQPAHLQQQWQGDLPAPPSQSQAAAPNVPSTRYPLQTYQYYEPTAKDRRWRSAYSPAPNPSQHKIPYTSFLQQQQQQQQQQQKQKQPPPPFHQPPPPFQPPALPFQQHAPQRDFDFQPRRESIPRESIPNYNTSPAPQTRRVFEQDNQTYPFHDDAQPQSGNAGAPPRGKPTFVPKFAMPDSATQNPCIFYNGCWLDTNDTLFRQGKKEKYKYVLKKKRTQKDKVIRIDGATKIKMVHEAKGKLENHFPEAEELVYPDGSVKVQGFDNWRWAPDPEKHRLRKDNKTYKVSRHRWVLEPEQIKPKGKNKVSMPGQNAHDPAWASGEEYDNTFLDNMFPDDAKKSTVKKKKKGKEPLTMRECVKARPELDLTEQELSKRNVCRIFDVRARRKTRSKCSRLLFESTDLLCPFTEARQPQQYGRKMDLSTLSTLLASHAADLSSLYGSLGASSETVPLKLEELHAALVGTVKRQKEAAEAEVAEVKERVDGLRGTLERKRRRLGESRTSSAHESNVETLLQARERLEREDVTTERTLQAREKQFTDARSRLAAFVNVLGRETVYAGLDEEGSQNSTSEAQQQQQDQREDLSLVKLSALEKEVTRCEKEVVSSALTQHVVGQTDGAQHAQKHREELLNTLIHDIFEMWGELGISPSSASTSASPATAGSNEEHLLDLAILYTLGASLPSSSSSSVVPLSARYDTIQSLQAKKTTLETLRETRMLEIQNLYDELYTLWTKLGITEEEADDFVELWKGCEERCIVAYRAELARMLQVKAENMVVFISREREDIATLWDALFYPDSERARFPLFDSDMATEEVLLAHEMEKHRLMEERSTKEPVLIRLAKYFELLDEIGQLEVRYTLPQTAHPLTTQKLQASANDPARLTGKGQRGDPGRLLREEKIRKRIVKEKPKLENDLLTLIPRWEQENNQAFMVHGSRFVEDLSARLEQDQASKAPAKRAKAGPAPASALKPQYTGTAPPLKRQMTGTSQPSSNGSAPSTAAKRSRTNTLSSISSTHTQSAAPYQRSMHTGMSVVSTSSSMLGGPVTPCPSSMAQSSARTHELMLGPTSSYSSSSNVPRTNASHSLGPSSSRLPLKAQHTSAANGQANSGMYHGLGLQRQPASGPTASSLFSPQALSSMQQQQQQLQTQAKKPSFRPRPSIASVSTATSSMVSSSSWGVRTASSATSVD
ncbi:Hypothetical predicted protein, partial [Olea europaea subsp. europaea]